MKIERGISFPETVFSSLAGAGPLVNFAILISYAYFYAGNYMFLSFILAFILFLFFMNTTYQLSKKKVGTGAYYIFLKDNKILKKFILIYFLYVFFSFVSIMLFLNFIFLPFILSGFSNYIFIIIFLIFTALIFLIIKSGIRPSIVYSSIGSFLEISFILIFSIFLLFHGTKLEIQAGIDLNGIFVGSLFSVLVFAGLGAPVSFGDEIEKPMENVKKSIFLSTMIEGFLFIFASFSVSIFLLSKNDTLGQSFIPIWNVVNYFGLSILIIFSALLVNSFFNILTLYGISLTRTIFSANEDRMTMDRSLLISILIILSLSFLTLIIFGPLNGFLIATSIATFNWIFFHDVLNITLIKHFYDERKGVVRNLIMPLIALVISIIIIYFIISSLSFPFYLAPLSTLLLFILYPFLKIFLKNFKNIKTIGHRERFIKCILISEGMKSFDILKEYVDKLNANSALKSELKGMTSVFQFKNDSGESFYLSFKEDGSGVITQGEHASPTVVLTAKEEDLEAIIDGKMDGVQAFFTGKLKIKGDPFLAQKLVNVIKKLK